MQQDIKDKISIQAYQLVLQIPQMNMYLLTQDQQELL